MTDTTLVATTHVTWVQAARTVSLKAGETITVPPDIAESMLGSGNFSKQEEPSAEDKTRKKRKGE